MKMRRKQQGTWFRAAAFAGFVAAALTWATPVAKAYPSYHPNHGTYGLPTWLDDSGNTDYRCMNCHVGPDGGSSCPAAYAPCLNVFGRQYRLNTSWTTIRNWDADGDGRLNRYDNSTSEGGPGFPLGLNDVNGLDSSSPFTGCSIQRVIDNHSGTTDTYNCSHGSARMQIVSTRSTYASGDYYYSFTYRCQNNHYLGTTMDDHYRLYRLLNDPPFHLKNFDLLRQG